VKTTLYRYLTAEEFHRTYPDPGGLARSESLPSAQRACGSPSAALVDEVFEHAIVLRDSRLRTGRGGLSAMVLLASAIVWWRFVWMDPYGYFADSQAWGIGFTLLPTLPVLFGLVSALQADLFDVEDLPWVFNRKTRTVHRFVDEVELAALLPPPPFWRRCRDRLRRCFSLKPISVVSYDWDFLEARLYTHLPPPGSGDGPTRHHLALFALSRTGVARDLGSFSWPSGGSSRDEALAGWEYVRRYMEEGGPPRAKDFGPKARRAPPTPFHVAARATPLAWPFLLAGAAWSGHWVWNHQVEAFFHQGVPWGLMLLAVLAVCWGWLAWVPLNWLGQLLCQKVDLPAAMKDECSAPPDVPSIAVGSGLPPPLGKRP
jgi:hypothetical protein